MPWLFRIPWKLALGLRLVLWEHSAVRVGKLLLKLANCIFLTTTFVIKTKSILLDVLTILGIYLINVDIWLFWDVAVVIWLLRGWGWAGYGIIQELYVNFGETALVMVVVLKALEIIFILYFCICINVKLEIHLEVLDAFLLPHRLVIWLILHVLVHYIYVEVFDYLLFTLLQIECELALYSLSQNDFSMFVLVLAFLITIIRVLNTFLYRLLAIGFIFKYLEVNIGYFMVFLEDTLLRWAYNLVLLQLSNIIIHII